MSRKAENPLPSRPTLERDDIAAYQERTAEAYRRMGDDIAAMKPPDFVKWVLERCG